MREPEKMIAAIVKATDDGRLVGRVRMQKIVYLLQQLGLKDAQSFDFSYHHYGPYSADVDSAEWFADAFGLVRERRERRKSDGALYSVFELAEKGEEVPDLPEEFRALANTLSKENSVILELAATAHWLSEVERVKDWKKEITLRKTWKVEEGRLEKALELLKELGLPPAAAKSGEAPTASA